VHTESARYSNKKILARARLFNMPVFTCTRRMLPRTVCLRFRNFVLLYAIRAARAAHSRFVLTACSIHVLSEIPQSNVIAPRSTICALCATRAVAPHTRSECAAMFHSCTLALRVRFPASRLRGMTAPP
jgi:hypothetical protein